MREFVAALAASIVIGAAPVAVAQSYPTKPVKIIVPFAPGGGNDVFARQLAQKLTEAWKQQVIVENRAGAGGNIGTAAAAAAAPDGYTLLLGHTGTLAINPGLYQKLPYDPRKDFVPISLIASVPLVLVVNPGVRAESVKDLITLAMARPGALNYASSGSGTGSHLTGELFKEVAKVDLTHIPYKGTNPAITDLLGGQVQVMFSVIPTALPHIQAGKLRAVAVTSTHRMSLLPKVPTVTESGLPGFESTLSYGILAPKGTPEPIVKEIHAQIARSLTTREMKERLAAEGAEPTGSTSAEFAALINRETDKWGRVIKASGARAE